MVKRFAFRSDGAWSPQGYVRKSAAVLYDKKKKHIALTFDDGASARTTPIVLMHDIHMTTVKAVPSICRNLKKKGYETVTVTELAAIRGTTLKAGRNYASL